MSNVRLAEGKRGKPRAYEDKKRKDAGKKDYWRGVCAYRCVGMPEPKNAQAYRESAAKAERAASDRADEFLRTKKPATVGGIPTNITVFGLCDLWIRRYEKNTKSRDQSVGYYKRVIYKAEKRPKPGVVKIEGSDLGKMTAVGVLASHVEAHLDLVRHTPAVAKKHRLALKQAFHLLYKEGLIPFNPAKESDPITLERPEPKPFTPEQYQRYLHLEKVYFARHPNANRERYQDVRQLMYDIVGRPGEALATRIEEDLELAEQVVKVQGTIIVYGADGGRCKPYRQDMPKTDESVRSVKVSVATVVMLRRRKLAAAPGQTLVFVNRNGNPISPQDFWEVWAKIVKGSDLEWSTPKALRKTAMKRIKEKYKLPAAQAAGGHRTGSRVTEDSYTGRDVVVADFNDALHS
ncbi:tyrosine-type recombinase/integrase [Nocardia sp. NPDC051052]|uniref:tyrosine-type recombinase/integrase n=1 Tax=Nocardia sp. NPDC051052 TaxID=3364322 RepID=UPI0037A201DC